MKPAVYFALIAALALAFASPSADAHSRKEATEPGDGAVLETSPPAISMRFDMPMRVTLISLTDQDGAAYDVLRSDNMQPVTEFSVEPPALPAGLYKVEWRGLATDGHPMQGTFSFEVSD